MTRCDLCGIPMETSGQTGYCSPRCLAWHFFGVPALKEDPFQIEQMKNQDRRTAPPDWTPPDAYPDLDSQYTRALTQALAALKISVTEYRQSHEK